MKQWFRQLESKLQGTPDTLLTVGMLVVAGVLIVTALTAPATLKAAALAWAVFP